MSYQRREKQYEILELLSRHNGKMTFGKLFGLLALNYGTTKKTFWSYLDALKAAEKIDYAETYLDVGLNQLEITLVSKE